MIVHLGRSYFAWNFSHVEIPRDRVNNATRNTVLREWQSIQNRKWIFSPLRPWFSEGILPFENWALWVLISIIFMVPHSLRPQEHGAPFSLYAPLVLYLLGCFRARLAVALNRICGSTRVFLIFQWHHHGGFTYPKSIPYSGSNNLCW